MKFPNLGRALCREIGIEFFFPEDGKRGNGNETYVLARKICANCPVREECLEWGIQHESHGMWGGTTPHERKLIRRKRKIVVQEILLKDYL